MSLSKPRRKIDELSPEQVFSAKRFAAVDMLARKAGFDDHAIAYTEFSLMPFFELVVEECAKVAELQTRNFTGENNEGIGCSAAANAIRTFGKRIGNHE